MKIANCNTPTGTWIRYEKYSDELTLRIVYAICEVLGVDFDTVMEVFGQYFMEYVREEGYYHMLSLLGENLREWLTNVNDLHKHLQNSLPDATFPEFWCVDDEEEQADQESMILHYYSKRGPLLASINVGIVKEIAKYFFKIKISMERIATQDKDDSDYTSWRIVILGPFDEVVSPPVEDNSSDSKDIIEKEDSKESKCPFGFSS